MSLSRALGVALHRLALPIACAIAASTPPLRAADGLSFDPHAGLDKAPWLSARAAAMSEAISPVANGLEAPYYNPAAIGGLSYKQGQGALRSFYFPYFGGAADPSSLSLNAKLREGKDLGDRTVAEELLRAYDGDHPYARFSVVPSVTFYRIFVGYVYDVRAASTPHGPGSDALDLDYRSQSGPMLGFSLASPQRDLYLGVSSGLLSRAETQGSFPLATVASGSGRKEAFSAVERHYRGSPLNLGAIYNFSTRLRPSVSLVVHNAGGAKFQSSQADVIDYKDREDITLGFGLSPNVGKWGMLNVVLEGRDLARKDEATTEKLRLGSELTFGNAFGSEAAVALRCGIRQAGPSFGIGLNLGLIDFEIATYAEDIGIDGSRVLERRSVMNIGINIAD